jgi:hypothetical protein
MASNNCASCLEPTESILEGCKHHLCDNCADSWYNQNKNSLTCSTCRQALTELDVERMNTIVAKRCLTEIAEPFHQMVTAGGSKEFYVKAAAAFAGYANLVSQRCRLLPSKLTGFRSVLEGDYRLTWGHTVVDTNHFLAMGGKNHMVFDYKIDVEGKDDHAFVVFTKSVDGELDFTK